jgi:hypothetical protein
MHDILRTDIIFVHAFHPPSPIVYILVKYITIELLAHVLVTPNFRPELRFAPRLVSTSEKRAIYVSSLFALISNWKSITIEMGLQSIDSFILRQASSHTLEERYAEALVGSR